MPGPNGQCWCPSDLLDTLFSVLVWRTVSGRWEPALPILAQKGPGDLHVPLWAVTNLCVTSGALSCGSGWGNLRGDPHCNWGPPREDLAIVLLIPFCPSDLFSQSSPFPSLSQVPGRASPTGRSLPRGPELSPQQWCLPCTRRALQKQTSQLGTRRLPRLPRPSPRGPGAAAGPASSPCGHSRPTAFQSQRRPPGPHQPGRCQGGHYCLVPVMSHLPPCPTCPQVPHSVPWQQRPDSNPPLRVAAGDRESWAARRPVSPPHAS